MSQLLNEPTDYFLPFPDARDVFGDDCETPAKYLLPLASVELRHLNREWEGRVHFVLPIEPHEGMVGQRTELHHTYLCRTNWIGYHVDAAHHYRLAADYRYFLLADHESGGNTLTGEEVEALRSWYKTIRESFAKRRKHFAEAGALHRENSRRRNGKYSESSRMTLVADLGGQAGAGNWTEYGAFPQRHKKVFSPICGTDLNCYPLAEDGSEFAFVGWLHDFVYVPAHGGCGLYLFYHHEQKLALTTFDWS